MESRWKDTSASASKVFSNTGIRIIPPAPLKKGGNYKELLLKSPFGKGEFRGI
jgi:hypothetical protein